MAALPPAYWCPMADARIILETPRLRLRQFTADDVDNLFALNSDAEVMRYINAHTMTVNAASRRVMEKCGLTLARTTAYERADAIEGRETRRG
jgi:RimJ/RimL family protein N-acetyltransferase